MQAGSALFLYKQDLHADVKHLMVIFIIALTITNTQFDYAIMENTQVDMETICL